MSSNTQAQGRTHYTEHGFSFTPRAGNQSPWGPPVGDDAQRALNRWEMELQRQLYVGDVTKDPAAKEAAQLAARVINATPNPKTGLNATSTVAITPPGLTIVTTDVPFDTATVTTGALPAGTGITGNGTKILRLTGTPTTAGAVSFTVTLAKAGFTPRTVVVTGTIA